MDSCQHVSKISLPKNHSKLNPEKWLCSVCGTTESVWACLSCANVACGRFNEEHALKHYQDTKHPLAIEVNERYVYCYECDDYVLNDKANGDLEILRTALKAIATQTFTNIGSRSHQLLRSYTHTGVIRSLTAEDEDKQTTADVHWRYVTLSTVFTAWRQLVCELKTKGSNVVSPTSPRKPALTAGVTGLRNLGNTCYMNSILQILSHLQTFRQFFVNLVIPSDLSQPSTNQSYTNIMRKPIRMKRYCRQSTVECFEHLATNSQENSEGLSGGSDQRSSPALRPQTITAEETVSSTLYQELHALFRVLWSAKWAQVSPHSLMQTVWTSIPQFKGYAQQDAQEFLCELLDKVQGELRSGFAVESISSDIITRTFQGELVSQLICKTCNHTSLTYEAFMDLSLEFPCRYQITGSRSQVSNETCDITEILSTFTEFEHLEGKFYKCEECNRQRSSRKAPYLTEVSKRLLIHKLPPVIRLHLKRFRWSGRNHREKISVHVSFTDVLDLQPFCASPTPAGSCTYRLSAVIMHHGKGFGSGHYTAYCWNSAAESWVHCNDCRLVYCSINDVLTAQAYILFYTKDEDDTNASLQLVGAPGQYTSVKDDPEISFKAPAIRSPSNSAKRTLEEIPKCSDTLKRRRSIL